MTRRGVLAGAAVIAGATALPRVLIPSPAMIIGHVVVDTRLDAFSTFAAAFKEAKLHPVDALDDLCNRWYTRLRRQVLADGAQLAGFTTWMDYIVMRSCAAEIGYRSTFHAEHLPAANAV